MDILFAAVALFGCWFVGVQQGKQWGAESVADQDAHAWRADIVARAKGTDSPADWGREIGPATVLHDFLERREAA